jgi:hypothetical protein
MNRSRLTQMGLVTVVVALLALAGIALAQEPAPPPPGDRMMFRTGGPIGPGSDEIQVMGFEAGIAGKTVTGAPFSATVTTEVTHVLADGNKIQRTVTGTIARDSQGRTRRDMAMPALALVAPSGNPAKRTVFINDPVAGKSFMLRPDAKQASEFPARTHKGLGNAERPAGELGFGKRFQNEETSADLGTQTINGLLAQGTRLTRTIPAGEIGNERPIVMTTERWYSSDLQMNVLIKRSDPLIGDTVVQFTNIQRQEPAASLFQVPSDYTVTQDRGRGAMRFHGEPGTAPQPPQPPQR